MAQQVAALRARVRVCQRKTNASEVASDRHRRVVAPARRGLFGGLRVVRGGPEARGHHRRGLPPDRLLLPRLRGRLQRRRQAKFQGGRPLGRGRAALPRGQGPAEGKEPPNLSPPPDFRNAQEEHMKNNVQTENIIAWRQESGAGISFRPLEGGQVRPGPRVVRRRLAPGLRGAGALPGSGPAYYTMI